MYYFDGTIFSLSNNNLFLKIEENLSYKVGQKIHSVLLYVTEKKYQDISNALCVLLKNEANKVFLYNKIKRKKIDQVSDAIFDSLKDIVKERNFSLPIKYFNVLHRELKEIVSLNDYQKNQITLYISSLKKQAETKLNFVVENHVSNENYVTVRKIERSEELFYTVLNALKELQASNEKQYFSSSEIRLVLKNSKEIKTQQIAQILNIRHKKSRYKNVIDISRNGRTAFYRAL